MRRPCARTGGGRRPHFPFPAHPSTSSSPATACERHSPLLGCASPHATLPHRGFVSRPATRLCTVLRTTRRRKQPPHHAPHGRPSFLTLSSSRCPTDFRLPRLPSTPPCTPKRYQLSLVDPLCQSIAACSAAHTTTYIAFQVRAQCESRLPAVKRRDPLTADVPKHTTYTRTLLRHTHGPRQFMNPPPCSCASKCPPSSWFRA